MQALLFRRTLRQLKANLFRYLALFFLIVIAIGIVIGVVGSAESVIRTVNQKAGANGLEDGQFTLFVPLTETQETAIETMGVLLEECFSLDFSMEDGSTLRLMKNREAINRIEIDSGHPAEAGNEIVLERLYAAAHTLSVGDAVTVAGQEFTVCGIGTTADYDLCLQNMSDMSADGSVFGTAFVTESAYETLRSSDQALHVEDCRYAYRLGAGTTDADLKDYLKTLSITTEEVQDVFFQEMVKQETHDRDELTDSIAKLVDGSTAIDDAMTDLDDGAGKLQNGIEAVYGALTQLYGNSAGNSPFGEILETLGQLDAGAKDLSSGTASLSESSGAFLDGMTALQEETGRILDEYFPLEIDNLTEFVPAGDNPRIKASGGDVEINVRVGIMAGILVMVLIAYVISVFTVHSIDQESAMIGALYALGLRRKELMLHYTMLPTVLSLSGGVAGTLLGYSRPMLTQMSGESFTYFSIPAVEAYHNPALLLYGILLPPLAAFLVSFLMIRKRLNHTALSLLKREPAAKKVSKSRLPALSFPSAFQVRHLLREKRSCFAMLAGIFLSLMILILGLNCYVLCHKIETQNVADTKYEYMYQFKYPEVSVPEGGCPAYVEGLKREYLGYTMEVSIIGLEGGNPFFPAIASQRKNEISISSSVAAKFSLKPGDELLLRDDLEETVYAFTVTEVVPYSPGLCVFMDIDSMRSLFGQEEDYYNVLYSNHALDIDAGRLYAVSTKADVEKSASIFLKTMTPLVVTMTGASVLIFLIVLYQMTKVMVDRSYLSISLMKVFGYQNREIRKLYLNGSFWVVAVGTLLSLPLAKLLMDAIYPSFVANVACGTDFTWPFHLYAATYLGTILCYLLIRAALMRKVKKLTPAEVLKGRE